MNNSLLKHLIIATSISTVGTTVMVGVSEAATLAGNGGTFDVSGYSVTISAAAPNPLIPTTGGTFFDFAELTLAGGSIPIGSLSGGTKDFFPFNGSRLSLKDITIKPGGILVGNPSGLDGDSVEEFITVSETFPDLTPTAFSFTLDSISGDPTVLGATTTSVTLAVTGFGRFFNSDGTFAYNGEATFTSQIGGGGLSISDPSDDDEALQALLIALTNGATFSSTVSGRLSSLDPAPVPEPTMTFSLFSLAGIAALGGLKSKKKTKSEEISY
ncbi:MAG: hypothetical protein ACXITR_08650 [Cyanobacterium sp.]